jgi:hypothetical protein
LIRSFRASIATGSSRCYPLAMRPGVIQRPRSTAILLQEQTSRETLHFSTSIFLVKQSQKLVFTSCVRLTKGEHTSNCAQAWQLGTIRAVHDHNNLFVTLVLLYFRYTSMEAAAFIPPGLGQLTVRHHHSTIAGECSPIQ